MNSEIASISSNILSLRPGTKGAGALKPLITVTLTDLHKIVLRRFARLRLERRMPRETVSDLFECHAQNQPEYTRMVYLSVLLPVLGFPEKSLSEIERRLDGNCEHRVMLDVKRQIIGYEILEGGDELN